MPCSQFPGGMCRGLESIYTPFLSIGSFAVSSCVAQCIGAKCSIIVAVKNKFYVYTLNSLRLEHVSPILPDDIDYLACSNSIIFVAIKSMLHVFSGGKSRQVIDVGRENIKKLHCTQSVLIVFLSSPRSALLFSIDGDPSKSFTEPMLHVFRQHFTLSKSCTLG